MTRAPNMAHASAASPPADRPARHAGVIATSVIALAALLLPAVHRPPPRLVWNASASVPLGLYRVDPGARPGVGDMVAVRPSPTLTQFMARRRYVESGALLLKPVAAVNGAIVCRMGLRVTVNGRPAATALPHDRIGRPLPRWSGCTRLRADQLFLIAPATAASFDSRYFGSVHAVQIVGRVLPVWTLP